MAKLINNVDVSILVASMEQAYQLKAIPRSGWLQAGIPPADVESIAAHSFGMSLLILYLRPTLIEAGIDTERCLHLAIVHDVGESIVGDITPLDQVSASEKFAAEEKAIDEIFARVGDDQFFKHVWDEFEAGISLEAQVVKRMDRLDMLIQAYLYEKIHSVNLDSFWVGMDILFKGSESEPIFNYIYQNRFETKGSSK